MKADRPQTSPPGNTLAMKEHATTMSGRDYLQAMVENRLPEPPISGLVGFHIVEVDVGRVVFEFTACEQHYGPCGTVQGGIPATVLESATACAVHSALEKGKGYTTIEVKFNLVRPITEQSGKMTCEGRLLHLGSRIATAEAKMTDANGLLYAHAVSTCFILQSGWK
jgi:uncharacterized protein (TIGR00369 family)